MDEIKIISEEKLTEIAAQVGFDPRLITKDYYITIILYLIKDVKGIYFKGGTALQKILLNHSRLSEDIDFTVTRDVTQVRNETITTLKQSKLFPKITLDRNHEHFVRIIVYYDSDNVIFVDLNQKAKLLLPPEMKTITHFYPENIPQFTFPTLVSEELIAEKVRVAIQRNKPRDHFDIYKIIKAGLPINLELVKKKCEEGEVEFDLSKMFNRAQKLNRRWDEDLLPLIKEEVSFAEVMKKLAEYFQLKKVKEAKRQSGIKSYYKYLEHTADVLFVAEAPTLPELFNQCALAVEQSMVEVKKVAPKKKAVIKLENKNIDYLLFDFLNELLIYKDSEQLMFSKFEVKIEEKKGIYYLNCLAYGEKLNVKRHEAKVDIKAITMHMFEVKETKQSWKAKVLVDI
jgi:SHS2 domain-containing protein/predicted nucleotidyltransferase component of viral defense system